jgi:hypothetical protein
MPLQVDIFFRARRRGPLIKILNQKLKWRYSVQGGLEMSTRISMHTMQEEKLESRQVMGQTTCDSSWFADKTPVNM